MFMLELRVVRREVKLDGSLAQLKRAVNCEVAESSQTTVDGP